MNQQEKIAILEIVEFKDAEKIPEQLKKISKVDDDVEKFVNDFIRE